MPQLDPATFAPQLFWLAVCFGVLYLIVSRVALPRVGEILQARRERIEADLSRAEALREEAEAALAAHERAMAEARAEARGLLAAAAAKAAAEVELMHSALGARLEAEAERAERRIAEAAAVTLEDLRGGADAVVREAALRAAGTAPSDEAIAAALERARAA